VRVGVGVGFYEYEDGLGVVVYDLFRCYGYGWLG